MKKVVVVLCVLGLFAAFSTAALAQEEKVHVTKNAPSEKPGGIVVDEISVMATVKAVDQAKRTLTLALPSGEVKTFEVAKEVVNFPQVKVGDEVKAVYTESLAIGVHGEKDEAGAAAAGTVMLAPKGAKPGAFVAGVKTITAKVTALDYKTRIVTLTGPEGNSVTFKAGDAVTRLNEVKVGDSVTFTYTESLLVDVTEAKPAPKATAAK
jgi:hypothetical protein